MTTLGRLVFRTPTFVSVRRWGLAFCSALGRRSSPEPVIGGEWIHGAT